MESVFLSPFFFVFRVLHRPVVSLSCTEVETDNLGIGCWEDHF